MNLPGFTAELSLSGSMGSFYGSAAAFDSVGAVVGLAQTDSIDPLISMCKQTTVCGPCERFCIPRVGCFAFKVCHCTTKDGGERVFTQPC
jgi:hypothetical protein